MATSTMPASATATSTRAPGDLLLLGAPAAAIVAGVAAQWLDFNALRYPLLLMVLAGVIATSYAVTGGRAGWRAFGIAVVVGVATWGAAETLYVIIHALLGEAFEAERFGGQWTQALGLIAVHALALGAPTGVVAGVVLQGGAVLRERRSSGGGAARL